VYKRIGCLVVGVTALLLGVLVGPAQAGTCAASTTCSTTTTFTVTSGALTITVPATASIGSGAPGTTISGALSTGVPPG
jgi:hypothetical protein